MSQYSSFKSHQLITENWRRYLQEDEETSVAEVVLPPDIEAALSTLADDPLEEGSYEKFPWDLPVTPDMIRNAEKEAGEHDIFDKMSPAVQKALAALATVIHGAGHGALIVQKGAKEVTIKTQIAREKVVKYLEKNPEKVRALEKIRDYAESSADKALKVLSKVAAIAAAGAMAASMAFAVYDVGRSLIDDDYKPAITWGDDSQEGSTDEFAPGVPDAGRIPG